VDDGWIDVLGLAELPEATLTRVALGDDGVLLFRAGDEAFAIGARCTHVGMRLDKGQVAGSGADAIVTCPAHGSRFRIADGRVVRPPAQQPLPTYDTRVIDGRVQLRSR
jgi:nitrite reductase/ring-hydroxylating ferredoxin subunit